jgi:hypothetical protein
MNSISYIPDVIWNIPEPIDELTPSFPSFFKMVKLHHQPSPMAAVSFVKRWRIPLLKPPHLQGIAASEHQKDRQVKSNKKNEQTLLFVPFLWCL